MKCTTPIGLLLWLDTCDADPDPMQVSRTDANVLFELNPEDLQVLQQTNYSAVIPEVQVCQGPAFLCVCYQQAASYCCGGMAPAACLVCDYTAHPYHHLLHAVACSMQLCDVVELAYGGCMQHCRGPNTVCLKQCSCMCDSE